MKRFLIFTMVPYEACGGWNDLNGQGNTREECYSSRDREAKRWGCIDYHIVDTEGDLGTVVERRRSFKFGDI